METRTVDLIDNMQMLYDSETFAVVHIQPDAASETAPPALHPAMARHGFEIVDKRSGKEVYLDGTWAELFHKQIRAWQLNMPSAEEVEETLEGYTGLAQNPVVMH